MLLLVAALLCQDIGRLGHDSWSVREDAEARLRAGWPLVVPWLHAAADSQDAEVRHRATAILGKLRWHQADARARRILYSPWPAVSPAELWFDEPLRYRLYRLALAAGVPEPTQIKQLLPEEYIECGWFFGWMPVDRCYKGYLFARQQVGSELNWPIPFTP